MSLWRALKRQRSLSGANGMKSRPYISRFFRSRVTLSQGIDTSIPFLVSEKKC